MLTMYAVRAYRKGRKPTVMRWNTEGEARSYVNSVNGSENGVGLKAKYLGKVMVKP